MTQSNGTDDFNKAIHAMKEDEPAAEQYHSATAHLLEKLGENAACAQPEVIRGCEDVRQLLPAFRQGQLPASRALVVETHLRECVDCRKRAHGHATEVNWSQTTAQTPSRRWGAFAMAAAAVLAICAFFIHNAYFAIPAGARAAVQSVDGSAFFVNSTGAQPLTAGASLYEGDLLRTGAGGHAFIRMADGSVVEVRERSEFSLKARGRDATIALDRGAVLVQAAKRDSGHLYVKTPDCRVAVTGTIFAVDSGIKGSRVSVVQGTVGVAHSGVESVLHAGDQVSTGANMEPTDVEQDIAWSRDFSKHLELLTQISKLQHRLEQVQLPGPRFSSSLLGRMPADSVFFASLPNAGQALEDAHRIFREQIQQNETLRQWWSHGDPKDEAKMDEIIAKLRTMSDYLGDEIVVVGLRGNDPGIAIVSTLRRGGIDTFLRNEFAPALDGEKLTTIDENGLRSLPQGEAGLVALVRQNEVVFGTSRNALERVNAQLDSGSVGLGNTEFGKRLQGAYERGAGFVFAADLKQIIADSSMHSRRRTQRPSQEFQRTGLADMRYLILEHREINGIPDNRMVLDFAGERRGIASWLAAPAPMGSLEFVSRNAAVAVSFVSKDPQAMLTDMFNLASEHRAERDAKLAEVESKLNLRLREDIVAHFGGDGAFALDGPVLPTPSWKLIVEVHDPAGLATSLEKLVQGVTQEAERHGHSGADMKSEDVSGQRYYTVQSRDSGSTPMYFTFSSGYMIVGPNRAVLMNALRTRAAGDSLARSGEFRSLLPRDENANYSAIAYQNLAPILQPLLSQMNGEQAKAIQELAADSRPSVVCARGYQDRIEAVTNSRLLGADWLALGSLLDRGTPRRQKP